MTWAFDEREMVDVLELNYGLGVSLVDLPGSQLAIAARHDAEAEPVLLDLQSLLTWLSKHRPDLLPQPQPQ